MANLKNKMNKLLFLIFILSLSTLSFYSHAAPDCVNNGGIKHGTMDARGGTIELKGMIKKNQEIARFTFKRDGSDVAVADCPDGAEFYAYATYSEASGVMPTYYMDIDGRPAYYVVRNGHITGLDDYAYVLIENESGLSFRSQPGQEVPVNSPKLNTRDATVIIYSTKDNPKSQRFTTQYIGSILINRFNSGGGTTAVGFSYRLSVNIISAPTSCSAENTNLQMKLPAVPITAFSEMGFPDSSVYAEDNLIINCSGNVSAKIKLMANNTTSYESQESVIKPDSEGGRNAKGVGFIVTSPLSDNTRLVNNQFVKLADLSSGTTSVPLKTEYFRYGNEVQTGSINATANFVLEFN
ncbi:fimbrial protein [Proteus columbae]|uniref:fimbrial protein n=1 Tax=Proteus columbae TaxID=1987580 RepID=UPI000C1EF8CB|nr:fimbrial protein [Proteus columbae]